MLMHEKNSHILAPVWDFPKGCIATIEGQHHRGCHQHQICPQRLSKLLLVFVKGNGASKSPTIRSIQGRHLHDQIVSPVHYLLPPLKPLKEFSITFISHDRGVTKVIAKQEKWKLGPSYDKDAHKGGAMSQSKSVELVQDCFNVNSSDPSHKISPHDPCRIIAWI